MFYNINKKYIIFGFILLLSSCMCVLLHLILSPKHDITTIWIKEKGLYIDNENNNVTLGAITDIILSKVINANHDNSLKIMIQVDDGQCYYKLYRLLSNLMKCGIDKVYIIDKDITCSINLKNSKSCAGYRQNNKHPTLVHVGDLSKPLDIFIKLLWINPKSNERYMNKHPDSENYEEYKNRIKDGKLMIFCNNTFIGNPIEPVGDIRLINIINNYAASTKQEVNNIQVAIAADPLVKINAFIKTYNLLKTTNVGRIVLAFSIESYEEEHNY